MAMGHASPAAALLLTLLLLLPVGSLPATLAPQAASLPRPGPPSGALPAERLGPAGQPGSAGEQALWPGAAGGGAAWSAAGIAGDATPISERRARAVAMTVFSLGTVVGAGFLAFFLIKRLL